MGIFSASHRKLAKEAWTCVFRTVTLRKCESNFDQKMKTKISVGLLKYNKTLGKLVFKHFNALSWILVAFTVISIAGIGVGIYNWGVFGNCNGANTNDLCLLNPETYSSGIQIFGFRLFEQPHTPAEIKPIMLQDAPSIGEPDAPIQIIEVGCFTCPFTKATEPLVAEVLQKYDGNVHFSFKYFPLPTHPYSREAAMSAECAREQGKFWEYKQKLFEHQLECRQSTDISELNARFSRIAKDLDLNTPRFDDCITSEKYRALVEEDKKQAIAAGIYGTPTFYVNGTVLVAPQSIEEFDRVIQKDKD
ncbi:MAG: thioredoxin domain-containing protein [Candidatus Diapherotrites archaeon]|nr:thioredoxin domain-containing protein [Candidatus Diapherotrites archaeon]